MSIHHHLAALCLSCAALAAAEPRSDGLVLHVPFDGNADAAVAAGSPAPTKASGLAFVPGRIGQAVEIAGDARLIYAGAGNFPLATGTLAVWAKRAVAWKDSPEGTILVKAFGQDWNQNSFYLMLTQHQQLRVWVWNERKEQEMAMSPNGLPYQAGTWYHLATSWTDGAIRVYVDGQEISYGKRAPSTLEMPTAAVKSLSIGSDYTPKAVWNGALDDLRIYDRVLAPEEIAKLVADAPAQP